MMEASALIAAGGDGAQRPLCPRCGYDQSGAIAAWERAGPGRCPLDGRCTECGLEFAWRDLLNPEYARRGTFFEHARTGLAGAFARTWVRCLWPWSLWRWVRMEQAIVPARLGAFAALATALFGVAALALAFGAARGLRWLDSSLLG